jgi:hypothetical protein
MEIRSPVCLIGEAGGTLWRVRATGRSEVLAHVCPHVLVADVSDGVSLA